MEAMRVKWMCDPSRVMCSKFGYSLSSVGKAADCSRQQNVAPVTNPPLYRRPLPSILSSCAPTSSTCMHANETTIAANSHLAAALSGDVRVMVAWLSWRQPRAVCLGEWACLFRLSASDTPLPLCHACAFRHVVSTQHTKPRLPMYRRVSVLLSGADRLARRWMPPKSTSALFYESGCSAVPAAAA